MPTDPLAVVTTSLLLSPFSFALISISLLPAPKTAWKNFTYLGNSKVPAVTALSLDAPSLPVSVVQRGRSKASLSALCHSPPP